MTFDLSSTPLVTLADGVLTLPVSVDAPGNPLDSEAIGQSARAVRAVLDGDLGPAVIKLVGLGRNFCAGGNVAEFAAAADRSALVYEVAELLHGLVRDLDVVDIPVVAAVTGWAAGAGLSLALAADIVVGGPGTRLLAAYTGIGYSPDGGMSWRLPRLVGRSVASRFILLNEPMDGRRAYELGILSDLAENDDDVAALATRLCSTIVDGPGAAQVAVKQLLRGSETASLSEQLDSERDRISGLATSPDGIEGVDAFMAKRAPRFSRGG